ncbi:MAG: hypothetical protein AAB412_03380 [Elusimicrobiota bacterium]
MGLRNQLDEKLKSAIQLDLPKLAPHLKAWAEAHLTTPRALDLFTSPEGPESLEFILVTDHTGREDANCRIVFNPRTNEFGLETTIEGGRCWFLGDYGSFSETVENM